MPSPSTLLLSGFPGWFGNRYLELIANPADHSTPMPKWKRIVLLVHPPRLKEAEELVERLGLRAHAQVDLIPLDISDQAACKTQAWSFSDCDLVHAAGIIHPSSPSQFTNINVRGTKNVLELAQRHGTKRAVLISSNSPCGGNPTPDHRFTPSSPYVPYMGYGQSKMQGEIIARHWSATNTIPLTILRPCWFFGPHQPERQARFFQMILQGKAPLIAGGRYMRSITYVDDLCQCVFRAFSAQHTDQRTYWVALEQPSSFKDIIETARRIMKEEFHWQPVEKHLPLPKIAATIAQGMDACLQKLGFYQQELHVLGELGMHISCSIEDTKRELGFIPTPNLHAAIHQSLTWGIAHGQPIQKQ